MHPILASRQRLVLYLAAWAQIAILFAAVYARASAAGGFEAIAIVIPLCVIYGFICLGAWYVCQSAPLRASGVSRVFMSQMGSAALSAALWLAMWEAWSAVLVVYPGFDGAVERYRGQLPLIFASGVLLFLLAGVVHYLLIAFEVSRRAETRELGLEVLAREAELKALRAQIDPHFLFNSLHSISALTSSDPAAARRMCLLLADFFRSSVQFGARERISLDEEIDMVRQYLDIERVRFGSRLEAEITIDPACHACLVPPLILQPLVENSVRHGINSVVEGGTVTIAARCAAGYLNLCVENPVDDAAPKRSGAGVGLENVKLRLRTLFGPDATTHVVRAEQGFRVELRFPCSTGNGRPEP